MTSREPPDPGEVLRHIPDALVLLDLEGRVVYCNERFAEMVGRAGEELRGTTVREVFPAAVAGRVDPSCVDVRAPSVHFNLEIDTGGGSRAYCFTATPVHDASGARVGLLEDFRGMDQLRQMILQLEEVNTVIRQEKERLDRILDSIGDGVFTVDGERRIRSFSARMEALTGLSTAEAVGRPCPEVLRGSKCAGDCPLTWSARHGRPVDRCHEALQPQAGRRLSVALTTAFLPGEDGQGLTAIVHDESEVERLRRELHERHSHHAIVGRAPAMREVFQAIESVAGTDATVLITGESGTGKEMVAQAIHHASGRRERPFVMVNCAALNDNLLESELFGHARGAFTGAVVEKVGRFELAGGGTIFLDEIGDTSPALQSRLLRVLQEKTLERVGESRTRRVDVRVIAATNRDLGRLCDEGRFRRDLYYRLAVVPIHLPALRERREDVPLLVQHFVEKYRARYFKGREQEFQGVSNRALALLIEHDWPGNVRELEHAVEYAMISTTTGRLERAFLPLPLRQRLPADALGAQPKAAAAEAPEAGGDPELRALLAVLEKNRWNAARSARELGISRTTLWRRLKRHDLAGRLG